jgi:hypothetical protein
MAALLAACGSSGDPPADIAIRPLSNRADLVSGGDALVEIVVPQSAANNTLKVDLNGADVTSAFAMRADGRITGVVRNLRLGENTVTATAANANGAKLTITNADRGGPVYSGGNPSPFVCATPVPQGATATTPATNGSGLSTVAVDANCTFVPEVKLYYKSTAAGCSFGLPDPVLNAAFTNTNPATTATPAANLCFKAYTAGTTPADMATTTTDAGVTVPYIVRVERGSINRGIYDIAVLHDPNARRRSRSGTASSSTTSAPARGSRGGRRGPPLRGPTTARCRAATWSP